ncbi:MAG: hypothetical protein ACRCXZ_05805 [Patescibacteria group bacterium]
MKINKTLIRFGIFTIGFFLIVFLVISLILFTPFFPDQAGSLKEQISGFFYPNMKNYNNSLTKSFNTDVFNFTSKCNLVVKHPNNLTKFNSTNPVESFRLTNDKKEEEVIINCINFDDKIFRTIQNDIVEKLRNKDKESIEKYKLSEDQMNNLDPYNFYKTFALKGQNNCRPQYRLNSIKYISYKFQSVFDDEHGECNTLFNGNYKEMYFFSRSQNIVVYFKYNTENKLIEKILIDTK